MKETPKRRTLEEMASDSALGSSNEISCPKCGCTDFRTYRTTRGQSARFRYKECRHCGHKVLTSSQTTERIIRDVVPHVEEDDGDLFLSIVG